MNDESIDRTRTFMGPVRARSLLLSSILGITCVADAGAVSLSTDGTGQVLLMPFYTVRDGHVTSVSVVNRNSAHTKTVKLRFREGLRGASALDINLFLAPRDVWTGSVIATDAGAALVTSDRSCTWPALPTNGLAFNNLHYTGQLGGTQSDQGGDSLDRTREGFVEIIEMGVVANGADSDIRTATPVGNSVAIAVLHGPNGVPPNCAAVQVSNLFASQGDLTAPQGGLAGSAIVIDAQRGAEFVVPVTALQRFFTPSNPADDLYSEPGSLKPDLASVSPARSDILNPGAGEPTVFTVPDWVAAGGQAIDAVSAVLMKSELSGEYDVSDGFQSELVLSFPTLSYAVLPPAGTSIVGYVPRSPFSIRQPAPAGHATTENPDACISFEALVSDREIAPYPESYGFAGPNLSKISRSVSHCRSLARWVVTPSGQNKDHSTIFGVSPSTLPLNLSANGALGAAPQYRAGWVALAPNTLGSDASNPGPGQIAGDRQNAVSIRLLLGITPLSTGGLARLAPVHADGVARRYRGLPMIGFSAVRARLNGQGYGGMFSLQGYAQPAP